METWKNDILNVVFICLDHQNQVPKIYSFNPFTDFASTSWERVSVVPAIHNHPWTLLVQSYSQSDVVCHDLFFDKTDNFGGYIVKTAAQYVEPYISYSTKNGVKLFEGSDYEIAKLLFGKLNVRISLEEKNTVILKMYKKKVSRNLLMQLENRTIDFAVNSIVLRGYPNQLEVTYVFYQTGISVITQYRRVKKIASHLFSFLPFHVIAVLFIASIVIFFLLRYLLRDPYSRNLIDILRIFLKLPIPRLPSTIRGRILFGITLVSFTVANMVIQSYMNTVLVSSNEAQNVEYLSDLIHSNYRVYPRDRIRDDLSKAGVSKIEEVKDFMNCSKLEEWEAFASKEISLLPMKNEDCHIPRKPIIPGKFLVYYTRRNWPIFLRINKRLLMLFEGGLTNYHIEKTLEKYHELVQEPDQYQVITMNHMEQTFHIFIFFNFISMIVFAIELFIARLSNLIYRIFERFI
ncbi:uncharacterized protein LOC141538350 isoform X2 [Cotesia typhae]